MKVSNEMRKLTSSFNTEADRVLEQLKDNQVTEIVPTQSGQALFFCEESNEFCMLTAETQETEGLEGEESPKTFQEAWHHPNATSREKWREDIRKELKAMIDQKVYRNVKKKNLPPGRKPVGCRWVFAIKRDGRFRARLVAKGYTQVAGIDFDAHTSPVMNDVTFRIMIVYKLIYNHDGVLTDFATAFLLGDLSEELYMDLPEGADGDSDECVKLEKPIYGLVQAARAWWFKLVAILVKRGFKTSASDPCLMIKTYSDGSKVLLGIYIDDCFWIGKRKVIIEEVEAIKAMGYVVTVSEDLRDYLSCKLNFSNDNKRACLTQPHLIKHMEEKFGEDIKKMMIYKTPGTPNFRVIKNKLEEDIAEDDIQNRYRSGVGMLLYLVKHSRPDIANAVRELTKCFGKCSLNDFKEMKRVMKFVVDTRFLGLKMIPKLDEEAWKLEVFSDSDFSGDKDTRLSVSGFILYVCGVPVLWKSKGQKSVSLSSTEAEYVAMSESVKEIKFVSMLLEGIGVKVQYPMTVRVDNIGAIYLSENKSVSNRTKHIDTRFHFVRNYVDEKLIEVIFVRSEENQSDGFTKNVSGDIHEKHAPHYMLDERHLNSREEMGRMSEGAFQPGNSTPNDVEITPPNGPIRNEE